MISQSTPMFLDFKSQNSVELIEFIQERNIKMVYWDIGGTLVDIFTKIKLSNIEKINSTCKCNLTLAEYDDLMRKEWQRRETPDAQQKIKSVKTDEDELEYWKDFFRKALKKYNLQKYDELVEKLAKIYVNARSFETYPFVDGTLAELADMGIRVGVISNAFRSARRILKQKGLKTKFKDEYILLSCEYNSIKPEENIYKKAIEKAGVEPQEIVFIDDRESFLGQAVKLGMNALVIMHGIQAESPLKENGKKMVKQPERNAWPAVSSIKETVRDFFLPVVQRFNFLLGWD